MRKSRVVTELVDVTVIEDSRFLTDNQHTDSVGCIMDTHSSDSSTGEPTVVRRRVDIAGNFAATRQRRASACQQSCGRGEGIEYSPSGDESVSNEVKTQGSEKVLLAENVNTSSTDGGFSIRGTDDQCRKSSFPRDMSRECGDGRQQEIIIVSSESSESSNKSERNDSTELYNWAVHEDVNLQYSNTDTESASEADDSSDFGGTSFSLVALDASYEKAEESLELEKEREEDIFSIISRHLSKVSLLTCEFHGIEAPVGKFVTDVLNEGLQIRPGCGVADSSGFSMEQKFEAIRTYVLDVCTVSLRQEKAVRIRELAAQVNREQLLDTTSSEDDRRKFAAVGKQHSVLRSASYSVRESRNVIARQLKIMDKLCAAAEKVVAKTEISCRAIFNCLKTIVSVLEPAVGMNWILAQVERKLESEGKGIAKFGDAVSATRHWTSEALSDAEVAVLLHLEASRALHAAWGDLEVMRSYQPHGVATFRRVTAAGDLLLDMAQQPTVSLDELRECESNMKLIRGTLLPLLEDMRTHRSLIDQWGDMCGERVPDILQALSVVTQGSCNAIEASLRGLSLLPNDLKETFNKIQNVSASNG